MLSYRNSFEFVFTFYSTLIKLVFSNSSFFWTQRGFMNSCLKTLVIHSSFVYSNNTYTKLRNQSKGSNKI